jgi:hypothetical protein
MMCYWCVAGLAVRAVAAGRKSWFRVGFDSLRQWIIHYPDKAAAVWNDRWKSLKQNQIPNRVV